MKIKRLAYSLLMLSLVVPAAAVTRAQGNQPLIGFWDSCPTPKSLPKTISIGAIFGLSGGSAVYGTVQQAAVKLAADEITKSGYLGTGNTLDVKFEDDAGDKAQAISAMTKLVTSDKVVLVLGPTLSNSALAADPVAQENKTPVLGVSNTANGITEVGDYIFRDSLPEAAVIPGAIAQAVQILNLKQVSILYGNDDDFTKGGYQVFKQALTDNKVKILDEETFAKGDTDFNAQLTKALGQTPDALIVSALAAEASPIISQARQLGYTGPIIGGNGLNSPAVIKAAGKAAEGMIVGAAWNIASTEKISTIFVDSYKAANNNALPDQFAAQAYTGAWLAATAIRCADSVDQTAVRDALGKIKDFDSPLGKFSFDDKRNPVHLPVVQIVKDGKFSVLSVPTSATPAATIAGTMAGTMTATMAATQQ